MRRQPTIDGQTGDWLFTYSNGRQEVSPIEQWIDIQVKLHCPYGKSGDRLWVRETHAWVDNGEDSGFVYRATDPDWEETDGWKWKPSLFMPREACRIRLEITDIRVERLNGISESDAIAEGIERWPDGNFKAYGKYAGKYERAVDSYASLWEKINGQESWAKNPFVWVVEFKKITI